MKLRAWIVALSAALAAAPAFAQGWWSGDRYLWDRWDGNRPGGYSRDATGVYWDGVGWKNAYGQYVNPRIVNRIGRWDPPVDNPYTGQYMGGTLPPGQVVTPNGYRYAPPPGEMSGAPQYTH